MQVLAGIDADHEHSGDEGFVGLHGKNPILLRIAPVPAYVAKFRLGTAIG